MKTIVSKRTGWKTILKEDDGFSVIERWHNGKRVAIFCSTKTVPDSLRSNTVITGEPK